VRAQANPHKRLRHLYGSRMMAQYKGVPLGELSPHVYAIAEQVGQCIVGAARGSLHHV
jgi:myosin-5